MSVLCIEHLTAGYGKRRILEDVSLRADAGEIVAILGENGSGKTTLLRAVQGILPLQSGTVTVNGTDLSPLNARKRAALVTMMPQDHPASAGLSGMDVIETAFYPSRGLFGTPTAADREKIRTSGIIKREVMFAAIENRIAKIECKSMFALMSAINEAGVECELPNATIGVILSRCIELLDN